MADFEIQFTIGKHEKGQKVNQKNSFFYASDSKNSEMGSFIKTKKTYQEIIAANEAIVAFNYQDKSLEPESGAYFGAPVGVTKQGKQNYDSVSIFKREIWEDGGETVYHPVALNTKSKNITDFNIGNNRIYEYIIQPFSQRKGQDPFVEIRKIIEASWQSWSLTELYPTEDKKIFKVNKNDVWLFKYNVQPSEQRQNISKTQQDNLGIYPTFSRGRKNNISSSITALLGSQVVNWNWITHKKVPTIVVDKVDQEGKPVQTSIKWVDSNISGYNSGGYRETVPFSDRLSSNEKIDMLNAWRKICYSGNPKLIKDTKGQKFLVQIFDGSNTTNDTWFSKPDTISFSWVEIGDLSDVQIYQEEN